MHQSLTEKDIEKLKSTTNVFKIMHVLFFAFAIIISLLSAIFRLKEFSYLETAGLTFLFLILIYIVCFLIRYSAYRKDLSQQTKIAAIVQVVKKSPKENDKVIWTNNAAIKRIEVLNMETFHLIEVGDELYVEQTLYSKFLLRLEKQGKNLINGG
jgi:uncharacterized protein YacL